VPWTDKIANEDILKQVNEKRRIIVEFRKKESRFTRHILRKEKLENIITTSQIKFRNDNGRRCCTV
jgi:hypothetical protein